MTVDHPSPTSKTNQAKRNLGFSGKEEEAPAQGENILNLPYLDSEEEKEKEVDLTKQVAAEHEDFPSPKPTLVQNERLVTKRPKILVTTILVIFSCGSVWQ